DPLLPSMQEPLVGDSTRFDVQRGSGKVEIEPHDHAIDSREKSIKNSCMPRMWKRQSHRGFRPRGDYLSGLWARTFSEPDEPRPRVARIHQGGEGRERTSGYTHFILNP